MRIGAIVLAGGRSRRMGMPKESLPFGDSTLLGRVVETLIEWAHPVLVVAREPDQELPPLPIEVEVAYDESPGEGPLCAILTGMHEVAGQCDAVFVTGCDVPFLDGGAVGWLAEQLGDHDVVIAKVDDVLQPLGAIYSMRLVDKVEQLVAQGVRTPRDLVAQVDARVLTETEVDGFDPTRGFVRSVNTKADYERALADADDKKT